MNGFTFHSPTKVIFGAKTTDQVGSVLKEYGASHVLVLYGGGSVVKNGVLERVKTSLSEAGLSFRCVGGIQPNPRLSLAQQIADDARDKGFDFLLAVGGGSVLDTMKGVSMSLACGGDIWDFFDGSRPVTGALPMGSIITLAAAGSETSDSAVLTNEALGWKKGCGTPYNRPLFAIMDPELTYTLPRHQTACGVADIMMHTLDRYFSDNKTDYLTDAIAEALLRDVMEAGLLALAEPENYIARSEIMWCGSLSHNDLTGLGHRKDFSVHQLGHELSAKFDIAHGESLTIMWASWARYVCHTDPERFANLGRKVFQIEERDDRLAAQLTINDMEGFFARLGLATSFSGRMGVQSDEVLEDLAARCSWQGKRVVGVFHPIRKDDMLAIYQAANR